MSRLTLSEIFENNYRRQNRSCASTAKHFTIQIRHFGRFLGHEPTLDDLTDDVLSDFLFARSQDVAAPTANKAYWCIVALWRRAFDLGMIRWRPTVQPLVEPEQIPFAWLKEELLALLRSCGATPGKVDRIPANLWWLGLHWVLWSTGERIGAVLSVRKCDLNLSRGELFVPAEIRKGRRKPRLYPLLPQAVETLKQFDFLDRNLLFPWPWTEVTLYVRYKRILKAAGLPTDRKCKFHRMRRSMASYLEAAGGNATAWLGHSGRRVTDRSYLDPRIVGSINPGDLLPPLDPNPA